MFYPWCPWTPIFLLLIRAMFCHPWRFSLYMKIKAHWVSTYQGCICISVDSSFYFTTRLFPLDTVCRLVLRSVSRLSLSMDIFAESKKSPRCSRFFFCALSHHRTQSSSMIVWTKRTHTTPPHSFRWHQMTIILSTIHWSMNKQQCRSQPHTFTIYFIYSVCSKVFDKHVVLNLGWAKLIITISLPCSYAE